MTKEPEAMQMAEEARETSWHHPSFVADLFMGTVRDELIFPFPEQESKDKLEGDAFLNKLEALLREKHDPDAMDRTGEISEDFLNGLKELGCLGIKVDQKYGGLGMSQLNYNRAIALVSSYCVSTAVWLSAHQSIGVSVPLKMFGTEEQKKKYLPRVATKEVSAFALTEPSVGSDPAAMKTSATLSEDGNHYIINGEKLWCTNGPVADVIIVMALTAPRKISAFIVETNTPGFEVVHRCDFMGMKGIQNGLLRFNEVKVPKENLLGKPGSGLRLALSTLNVGRLTLPASCVGGIRQALAICREWSQERVQWGNPIGQHDEVAAMLTKMASHLFAMESMSAFSSILVDKGGFDIRLEAAMTKLFCSLWGWELIDDAVQIRGGRGYETAPSLKARGEKPYPIERMLRDARINLLIEGSTEIMHLFIAREFLDQHMQLAAAIFDPKASLTKKLKTLVKAKLFYLVWYPRQWIHCHFWPKHAFTPLGKHLRFVKRTSKRLARTIFHILMIHRLGLQKRQQILARLVHIGMELFAMQVTCSRALTRFKQNPVDRTPLELADHFCFAAKKRVKSHFKALWCNQDKSGYKLARKILSGDMAWLEQDIVSCIDSE